MRSFTATLNLTLASALLLGGCVGDDQGTSAGSASTTEASSTTGGSSDTKGTSEGAAEGTSEGTGVETTGTSATATDPTEGTTEGTTDATTEGTTATTDPTTGGEACAPEEEVSFHFQLLPEKQDFKDFEVDYLCSVEAVSPSMEGGVALEMSCTDGDEIVEPNPILEVSAEPATELVAFAKGAEIRLIYGEVHPWWTERWVRIEALGSGDLLLAGVTGSSLKPNDKTDVFAPYAVDYVDGVCAPGESGCGVQQRLRIDVEGEGGEWSLLDSSFDIIAGDPGLSTWIDDATAFVGRIQCSDTPQRWFSLGMIFDGQE